MGPRDVISKVSQAAGASRWRSDRIWSWILGKLRFRGGAQEEAVTPVIYDEG